MKHVFAKLLLVSLVSFPFVSCQKDGQISTDLSSESSAGTAPAQGTGMALNRKFTLKVKPLVPKQINEIVRKLEAKKIQRRAAASRMEGSSEEVVTDEGVVTDGIVITDQVLSNGNDAEIRNIISPLVQNGQQIYQELLYSVTNSPEWSSMTEEERSTILNISSESQFCDLALIYSTAEYSGEMQAMRMNTDAIKDCVSFALGISGISGLISNTSALMSVSGAVQILKTIGKRYLSYVGIAWMIWDFTDCISHF